MKKTAKTAKRTKTSKKLKGGFFEPTIDSSFPINRFFPYNNEGNPPLPVSSRLLGGRKKTSKSRKTKRMIKGGMQSSNFVDVAKVATGEYTYNPPLFRILS
jgi:hypothetical protein